MAPSVKALEAKLRAAVEETYVDDQKNDESKLTVKYVRNKVERELGLEEGFFVTEEWKDKSKTLIKAHATKLMDDAEDEPTVSQSIEKDPTPKKKAAAPPKSVKRSAQEGKAPPKKRQKKQATPSDISVEPSELSEEPSEDSTESEFDEDSDISDAPKPKKSAKSQIRAPVKRGANKKSKEVDSEEDDEPAEQDSDENSDSASTQPKKKAAPPNKKTKHLTRKKIKRSKEMAEGSDDESADSGTPEKKKPSEDDLSSPKKATQKKESNLESFTKPSDEAESDTKANDSDSSEMSVVLDEGPKPKHQRRTKAEMAASKGSSKSSKPKLAKEARPAKDLSPAEAQIKTLQSQLVKCGIRKIWGIELKQFGDDSREKIRHLSQMLKDAGMMGRFSDARAREIKELRELQADLAAVTEGEKAWGLESGRRARGAQRKSFRESTGSEEEDEDDGKGGQSRGVSEKPADTAASKAAKARNELAFLGDDDESDSD